MSALAVRPTEIAGLLVLELPLHGDARGWFKENWQRAKMTALGLPDFGPVQHSVAHNAAAGVTRGFHAEPWDKLVSVEMIEAVGAPHLQTYLAQCCRLLRPDGLFALQAITIADSHYTAARDRVDFIKRHIFPGSFIPSVTAILEAATATGGVSADITAK